MMEENKNPHDQFFKETFSQVDVMVDFLNNYLPAEIVSVFDLTTVERLEDSLVDAELKEHLSDLLFRAKTKTKKEIYVYLLLEHKSSPDRWVAFQLLRYLVRIWEKSQRQDRKKLPLVLPIDFYHGKRGWTVSEKFSALFEMAQFAEFGKFLPDFSYHLCDLNKFSDDELKGNPTLLFAVRVLKHIFQADLKMKLTETLEPLAELADDDKMRERFGVMTKYLLGTHKVDEKDIITAWKFVTQGDKTMETFIDRWINKGVEQGMQQGMQQGWLDATSKLVLRQLKRRIGEIDEKTKSQIVSLPLAQLEQLSEDLLDFERPEDLQNWLEKQPLAV